MTIQHNLNELQATIQEFWTLRRKPMSFLLALAGKKFSRKAAQIFKQEVMPQKGAIETDNMARLKVGLGGIRVKKYRIPNPWGGGDIYTRELLFADPVAFKSKSAQDKARSRQARRSALMDKYGFATAAMTGASKSGLKAGSIRGFADRAMQVWWELQNREWHRGFATSAMIFNIKDESSVVFSQNTKSPDKLGRASAEKTGSEDSAEFVFTWGDTVGRQSKNVAQALNRPRSEAAIAKAIALVTADFRQDIRDRLAGMYSNKAHA